jgi:hypothetical protein
MSIYVETLIHADLEDVWRHTQTPELHARWDLRFTSITYLPRPDLSAPQRFLYETRIGFGLRIQGEGETLATREDVSGVRTSSLRFWSDDPKSLIRVGSGYWQYIPQPDGVRFLTRYQYDTRFGPLGRLVNTVLFEPLLGWATAWSFDLLRLWLEQDLDPSSSLERSAVHAIARVSLATMWVYQGLVPKFLDARRGRERAANFGRAWRDLLRRDSANPAAPLSEVELVRRTRVLAGPFAGHEPLVVRLMGAAEIAFGLGLLSFWRARLPLLLSVPGLIGLTLGVARSSPAVFRAPFNPATLNLAMIALSVIAFVVSGRRLPTAARCLRQPPPLRPTTTSRPRA